MGHHQATRTYLCPECDGYGQHEDGAGHYDCRGCDGLGVVRCEYTDELQPWTGPVGRMAQGGRTTPTDPLLTLARMRRQLRDDLLGRSANYQYGLARQRAVSPVALPDLRGGAV